MNDFIIDDGQGKWFYENGTYSRLGKDGKVNGRISGRSLPDPEKLYEAYQSIHPKARKPAPATYALWNHWSNQCQA